MKILHLDITYDNVEGLLKTFETLTQHHLLIKVNKASGPGGSWPDCSVIGKESDIRKALVDFDFDKSYYEEYMNDYKV